VSEISAKPVLWHITVSHYSEKVRWALDWKGVEVELRATPPGAHMARAMVLTRGAQRTFPVLELDGRRIGDSTAIIAALEERFPEPPLYPADPAQRSRALELEDFFDEELAPYTRHLAFHYLRQDREGMSDFAAAVLPGAATRSPAARRVSGAIAKTFSGIRYGIGSDDRAEKALAKVGAAMDRLELELAAGDGEHLVGSSFTVADLSAAALFGPLVIPAEGPSLPQLTADFAAYRDRFRERRGFRWVEATFARYRRPNTTARPGLTSPGTPARP
jgi:glutathione S-transferase